MGTLEEKQPMVPVDLRRRRSSIGRKDDAVAEGNVRLLNTIQLESEILCCRFNDAGKLLAIGLTNGNIMIYSVDGKGFPYILKQKEHAKVPVTSLRWKPDHSNQDIGYILMATYVNGECKRWHVTSSSLSNAYVEDTQLLTSAYNSSGDRFVAGSSDGRIFVYDEVIGEKIHVMNPSCNGALMDGHMMRVFALQYNPQDDRVFVSGGWDNTIQWWDTRVSDQHSIKRISGPHICGEGIDIERNTQNLLVASWRRQKNLQVYDFGTGKVIKEIPPYANASMLYCAQWKDRSSVIVGGCHNHMMSVADYTTALPIGSVLNLPGGVCAIDHTRVGSHSKIAAASHKQIFFISDDV